MKKCLRFIAFVCTAAAFAFILSFKAGCVDFGTDELYGALPENALEYLEEKDITPENNGIMNISVQDILSGIFDMIGENIGKPLRMFTSLLAVILLTSLAEGLRDASGKGAPVQVFSLVSALAAAITVSLHLSSALSSIGGALSGASGFMLTYIPVLAGVIAIGGHASTAAVFSSVTVVAIQILAQLITAFLLPCTSSLLGISAAGGLNPDLKTDRLGDGIKKAVIWGLGLIMTVFMGILSVQSTISASADSVALRAARFAVASSVPFVGGAVSDALATVKSSISLLKSGIGGFGIAAGGCILLPVIINAACFRFFLFLADVVSDIFGNSQVTRMIKAGENVMSIIISMLACFFLFITISTAVMLSVCRG